MDKLKTALQKGLTISVVENFMDPLGPMMALEKAANAPPGQYTHLLLHILINQAPVGHNSDEDWSLNLLEVSMFLTVTSISLST